MSGDERQGRNRKENSVLEELGDPVLQSALRDFRDSVHAWSEAEFVRPHRVVQPVTRHGVTRRSLAWALGLVIAAGAGTAGLVERHHQQELAREEQQRLQQQRELAQKQAQAQAADLLLAHIESDVSREVPSAMDPLAQLMTDDAQ